MTVEFGMRELRNESTRVLRAVQSGERVVLTVNGEPVADIVPHVRRSRWVSGVELRRNLLASQADPALRDDVDRYLGDTADDL